MARRRRSERARDALAGHPLVLTVQNAAALLGGLVAVLTIVVWVRSRGRRK